MISLAMRCELLARIQLDHYIFTDVNLVEGQETTYS